MKFNPKNTYKKYALSFEEVLNNFNDIFQYYLEKEKSWLIETTNKLDRLTEGKSEIERVVSKLQDDQYQFIDSDNKDLSVFNSRINSIVNIADRINNFKQGVELNESNKLELHDLFNELKQANSIQSFNYTLNQNLKSFLPHLFSVIKNIQKPDDYPIFYPYWRNILNDVFNKGKNYDELCIEFRKLPLNNRTLEFGAYYATIGNLILKDLKNEIPSNDYESKEWGKVFKTINHTPYQEDVLDFSEQSSTNRFNQILSICSENEKEDFFSLLNHIIDELKIEKGDQRITYSVPKDRIALTIGQRYAISLQPNTKRGALGIISVESINDSSEMYDGTPPQPYYTYFKSFKLNNEKTQDVIQACQNELVKTVKSGYLKSSNKDFEDFVFNNNYPRNLQSNIESYKSLMIDAGFEFIREQNAFAQERGSELVFNHSKLLENLNKKGIKAKGKQFYIKRLNDDNTAKIGLVNGKSTALTLAEFIEPNGVDSHDGAPAWYNENLNQLLEQIKTFTSLEMKHALNTILYGPPGTGKTYNTAKYCAEILTGEDFTGRDEEAREIFNNRLGNQIEFITFHQNYSYEDFIQGLRPDTDGADNLSFVKTDGVFKKISKRAQDNINASKKAPEEVSKEKQFKQALDDFIDSLVDNDGVFNITDNCQVYEVEEDAFRYKGENWVRHSNGIRMKFDDLEKFFVANINSRKEVKALENISALSKQHATYYFGVYDEIKKYVKKDSITQSNQVQRQNYIIVIDEINRANISRVFGELITLIEDDKRSEGDTPLKCKLPSGDEFQIPSNLFILGTMNTADKSIALLDIALRRRFEFVPLYPNSDLASTEEKKNVLEKINKRIFKDKGPDFQIGHAYFMKNDKLEDCMNKKVVPLLTEYYMNATDEVIGILKEVGFETTDKYQFPIKVTKYNG